MHIRRALALTGRFAAITAMGVAALALVVWLAGRAVSDRYEWSQWIAWIPTFAAIAVAALGVVGSFHTGGTAARKRIRRAAWALVCIALIIYAAFIEHRLLTTRNCDAPGLRIVHWNASNVPNRDQPAAAATLAALDADVIILTNPSRIHRQKPLLESVADHGAIVRPRPFAVITTLPVIEARPVAAAKQKHIAIVRLDAGQSIGRELTIWIVDLPSDPDQPRMETAQQIRRWIDQANLPPADIIVGDFNMTRGSAALHVIAPDYRHAFNDVGVGYGATYPREYPWLHIDHMLISDSVHPLAYCIHDPGVGSHRLQIMTLPLAH